jgi:hypothetical protein
MFEWFRVIVDRKRFFMHDNHYKNMRKFLREILEGSNISRENIHFAY